MVISACAELARRIVTGQPVEDDEKGKGKLPKTMNGWFTVQDKGKQKASSNDGKILVVVGYDLTCFVLSPF